MKAAGPACWTTEPWTANRTMATKMATMSNGPKTLGRMPVAIRSESNSPERVGAGAVVVAIFPPWIWRYLFVTTCLSERECAVKDELGSSGTGLINSGMADPAGHAVELVELRVLEGPNLYFTRPAIKLTLAMPGWLELPASRVEHEAERLIPVVAVTGTNGKTTTVRLLAHLARTAGKTVAYTSTDGVYRNQELKVPGDYSGFGGAAEALGQPGIDLAVLEVARGGILLRGIGAAHNDVAVVTNVSEDHLDQYGIRTLDQLAEVKASITHITRPDGWDILNADDPRVLSMSREARGRTWLFSVDHDHP